MIPRWQDPYYNGQSRQYGPEGRPYPQYESDGAGGPMCDYRHSSSYPGGPRTLLPLPPDDRYVCVYTSAIVIAMLLLVTTFPTACMMHHRNQGMRRGYDSYSRK